LSFAYVITLFHRKIEDRSCDIGANVDFCVRISHNTAFGADLHFLLTRRGCSNWFRLGGSFGLLGEPQLGSENESYDKY